MDFAVRNVICCISYYFSQICIKTMDFIFSFCLLTNLLQLSLYNILKISSYVDRSNFSFTMKSYVASTVESINSPINIRKQMLKEIMKS